MRSSSRLSAWSLGSIPPSRGDLYILRSTFALDSKRYTCASFAWEDPVDQCAALHDSYGSEARQLVREAAHWRWARSGDENSL
jgi:hypothetical protein